MPLQRKKATLEEIVKVVPSFQYQLSFVDPAKFEDRLRERKDVERVFRGFFRPKPLVPRPRGQLAPINTVDCILDAIGDAPRSDMITEEDLQYYVDYFTQGGFHGPCNWYRTRLHNWNDEKECVQSFLIKFFSNR